MYGLDITNVTGITMGVMYLVLFDPYDLLYSAALRGTDPVFEGVDRLLRQTRGKGQFVVPISHYPLICSGSSSFCTKCKAEMRDYWQSML